MFLEIHKTGLRRPVGGAKGLPAAETFTLKPHHDLSVFGHVQSATAVGSSLRWKQSEDLHALVRSIHEATGTTVGHTIGTSHKEGTLAVGAVDLAVASRVA